MSIELREYKDNSIVEGLVFKVLAPANSCIFCDNCTDVWWDFTNGPWLFFCDILEETNVRAGLNGKCSFFKETWDNSLQC